VIHFIELTENFMSATAPKSYSKTQKVLHWLVAVIILEQLILGESMTEAWRAFVRNADSSGFSDPVVLFHIWGGLSVVAFAAWRLLLRKTSGVPAEPASEPAWMRLSASLAHIALYALMFLVPISGAVAYFGNVSLAGEVHEFMKPVLIIVLIGHVVGALYQHFVAKTDVLKRMTHG
jgi:cytochrome b561